MSIRELEKFDDRELLARVLQAEAGNQDLSGRLAVASVIQNRAREGGYGEGLRGVLTKPGQFSPVNYYTGYARGEQGQNLEGVRPDKETYAVVDAVLSGQYEDPTGGATHFYNPDISQPNWGRSAGGEWMTLGDHIFGRANAGREGYRAPTSNQTYEARRAQYGLGDRDPGNSVDVLDAVRRGDMTKSEAGRFVSEDLLEGIEGGSAYDILKAEEDSFLDKLGGAAGALKQSGLMDAPEQRRVRSLPTDIYRGRQNIGSRALQRMGIASLA